MFNRNDKVVPAEPTIANESDASANVPDDIGDTVAAEFAADLPAEPSISPLSAASIVTPRIDDELPPVSSQTHDYIVARIHDEILRIIAPPEEKAAFVHEFVEKVRARIDAFRAGN